MTRAEPFRITPRGLGLGIIVVLTMAAAVVVSRGGDGGPVAEPDPSTTTTTQPVAPPRTVDPYRGLGAWVDVFDFDPAYQPPGGAPLVTPDDVAVMATYGVDTLFLQAARHDERSPTGLANRALLERFLAEAHDHGIDVVGWYLPKFAEIDEDLRRLEEIAGFHTADGIFFDGIAVDIEFTDDVPDHDTRSNLLVELSRRFHDRMGDDVLGAIVLPPVLIEVVNEDFWPGFPWLRIRPFYDVWLPMSYWSFRSDAEYGDGYTYNAESIVRLRENLGDPDAFVHPIGGIGDQIDEAELGEFLRSLVDNRAIGGSIYDFRTMSLGQWGLMRRSFDPTADGMVSNLPDPVPLPPELVENP